jgi:hypothetical protein
MQAARIVFIAFLGVGILLLAIGAYTVYHTRQFIKSAVEGTGMVIENVWQEGTDRHGNTSGAYYPRVRFRTASGRDMVFLSGAGSMPAAHQTTEAVTILYDPSDPTHASIKGWSLWIVSMILLGLGSIFSTIGIVPLAWQRNTQRRDAQLRSTGQRIQADFDRVERNTQLEVNGTHPYRIVSQWLDPATNQVHVFKSHNIWFDPTSYIPGKTIEVMINPKNLRRYVVETGFLPRS